MEKKKRRKENNVYLIFYITIYITLVQGRREKMAKENNRIHICNTFSSSLFVVYLFVLFASCSSKKKPYKNETLGVYR
jgi:hypothetical protein